MTGTDLLSEEDLLELTGDASEDELLGDWSDNDA